MKNSKSSKFTGCGNVFKFTYIQSMKSKATLITMAIFCIIALVSFPVMSLFDAVTKVGESKIENIYVLQEDIDVAQSLTKVINHSEGYKNVKVNLVEGKSLEEAKKEFIADGKDKNVIINITVERDKNADNYGITYSIYYNENFDEDESDSLTELIEGGSTQIQYMEVGIAEEDAKLFSQYIQCNSYALDEQGNVVSDGISEAQYTVNYTLLMIMILSISFAGSKVAEQIVTEKSSKVIEYILTSVKPMAIITGKVFASLAVVLTMLGSVVVSFIASGFINGAINATSGNGFVLPEILTNFFDPKIMVGANALCITISLLIFIEGFIFYGFLAGVCGAMVSKVEELSEGIKMFTFAMLIGAYLALALLIASSAAGEGWGNLNYIVYLLPLSAPFIVPAYMLFGIIPPAVGLLVIAINLVCIVVLIVLVSKIYEQLIYHNGSPLKVKDLFKLAKGGNK